jgi:hypothetical protein
VQHRTYGNVGPQSFIHRAPCRPNGLESTLFPGVSTIWSNTTYSVVTCSRALPIVFLIDRMGIWREFSPAAAGGRRLCVQGARIPQSVRKIRLLEEEKNARKT